MNKQDSVYIEQLKAFLRFPSVSSDPSKKEGIINCALWLVEHLKSIGLQTVKIFATKSHPVVYAEHISHPNYATILFYGHYDVQPADPIEKWHSPPFQPVIKDNYLYGRGASDDKGQLFIHIKAVEQLLESSGKLPVNIKFLIEGAEEIGSEGLKDFIEMHKKLLSCNAAVVSDTKMSSVTIPAITYSLRGSLNAEISIQTSEHDVHSGTFGGYVPNAAVTLSDFITRLFQKDNSIAIPGFYDDVETVSPEERRFIKANGTDDRQLMHDARALYSWGEMGYTMHERTTIRPALSVTGITSGFQGKGVKNSIPSLASVKLNFRLVPNQSPQQIRILLEDYIRKKLPAKAMTKTSYSSLANPVKVSRNNDYILAATRAYENVFQQKVKLIRNGGTIAAVDYLHTVLGVPVVLMGFAQANDNMHAPDEKFYLPNFFRGINTVIEFMKYVALINRKTKIYAAAHY